MEGKDGANGHADADTEMPSVDADADEGAAASAPARARLAKRPVDKGISGQNGYLTLEPRPNQVYIKAIGPDFSRKEVEEVRTPQFPLRAEQRADVEKTAPRYG